MVYRCADCNNPLTREEVQVGRCPACGFRIADIETDIQEHSSYVRESRPWRGDDRDEPMRRYDSSWRRDDPDEPPRRQEYESPWRRQEYDVPSLRSSRVRGGSWGPATGGLMTMIISIIAIGAATLFAVLFGVLGTMSNQAGPAVVLVIIFLALIVVAAGFAYLVGMILCATAPGGRGWMIASLGLIGAALVLAVLLVLLDQRNPGFGFGRLEGNTRRMYAAVIFLVVVQFMWLAALVCESMYSRAVGVYFARRSLVINSTCFVAVLIVSLLSYNIGTYYSLALHAEHTLAARIMSGVGGVIFLGLLVWKPILLAHTRSVILSRA